MLYGAAEFSRDIDLVIHISPENVESLCHALDELRAKPIAVPPFEIKYLNKGHAVHFRCEEKGVERLRVDVMSKMRGVDSFDQLWERRTTIEVDDHKIEMLALPDLIKAKRTQREKDWLMTNRLIESHHTRYELHPTQENIDFWVGESFDLELLELVCNKYGKTVSSDRKVVAALLAGNKEDAIMALAEEKRSIMHADTDYWRPLKEELEQLRRNNT